MYICNMEQSTHQKILGFVEKTDDGKILFPTDFRGMGTEGAIKMALSRLVKEDKLDRLSHGIYLKPGHHPSMGKLHLSLEDIAQAIADREKIRIKTSGSYALNRLGLSSQVPTRLVYITDGQARQFTIGRGGIKFKPASPKKFAMKGEISSLLLQAQELGPKRVSPQGKQQRKCKVL